jgi:subtilisin family serine protease
VIAQKLEECALNGVACFVAAGSTGGRVEFPATSPHVFAVGAVGRLGEFPTGTWDAETVQELDPREGLFSPSFTCIGPEVAACAPGVGIVSTAPGGEYEPESGTSMAAAHIAGLATLLLAHHPLFTQYVRARGPQRVGTLFQAIRSICTPALFSPGRAGAGMPRLDLVAHQLVARNGRSTLEAQEESAEEARVTPLHTRQPALTAQGLTNLAFAARTGGPAIGAIAPQLVPGLGPLAFVVPSQFFYPWLI